MTLWTIQPIEWYERLLTDGIIYGERQYVEPDFIRGYEWLITQMEERIGPRPMDDSFPVWAWHTWAGYDKKRPDLRATSHLRKGEKGVRIEFEKDPKDVLLSDFTLWYFPLAYHHYICRSEEEDIINNEKLLAAGYSYQQDFSEYPSEIQDDIISTWPLIFELDFYDQYVTHKPEDKSIQATFWSLSLNEIKKVDHFTSR